MKKLLALSSMSLFLLACEPTPSEAWVGFYYPTATDPAEIQEFDDSAACEEWALEKMADSTDTNAHYYCGYQCIYDKVGQYSCEN